MKVTSLLNRSVFATLLLSASFAAFAGGGARGSDPRPDSSSSLTHGQVSAVAAPTPALHTDATPIAGGSTDSGKTRAQVRAELLQAEEAGLIPANKNDYPPSAETIARNRVRFQQIEQAWRANGQVTVTGQ
ncbi:DUF4148 domain-containing protein [Trinickia mobilis]|uniref:DUF4148 domain-containing protein n=1 Tax=Trinickia mobilis TaxID=2816356 RepID=UPI001A8F8301|nr:DUF4148 domain-containing protein [Trinickia mobilis]